MANYEVKLKDGNDYLFPQAMLNGIDENNALVNATTTKSYTYTAIQDCYVSALCQDVLINNVSILTDTSQVLIHIVPIKKGDVVKVTRSQYNLQFRAYGIKH